MTITINFKGRLGNQLYQYAALRAISIEKKYKIDLGVRSDMKLSTYLKKEWYSSLSKILDDVK